MKPGEFAFHAGDLALLQIRPLNPSRRAHQRSRYLAELDADASARGDVVPIGALSQAPHHGGKPQPSLRFGIV